MTQWIHLYASMCRQHVLHSVGYLKRTAPAGAGGLEGDADEVRRETVRDLWDMELGSQAWAANTSMYLAILSPSLLFFNARVILLFPSSNSLLSQAVQKK